LLNNLLLDMQLDNSEINDDAVLVYKNIVDLIEIFIQTPTVFLVDKNCSKQFQNSLARQPMIKT